MAIDLRSIATKIPALLTPSNILGTITIALLVTINWDVLVLRYRQFVDWAPWVPPAVAQAYSILISVVLAVVLHRTIGFLLELVYFGPLKRLNKLEKHAHEKISKLSGQSFCQNMVLSILAANLTETQIQDLDELSELVNEKEDGPMKEGALQVLQNLAIHEGRNTTPPLQH